MPMYEFRCNKCGKIFEELVFDAEERPNCTKCGSDDTEKVMSTCCLRMGAGSTDSCATSSSSSHSGCAGCSGGNCATCGH